ncbi:hypothetical protein FKH18_27195 [Salmonella enterica]|uniref:Uncharacterized protein n=2 Tax=Salmonella enterica TaxID=28901 RepID=A0A619I2Y9_SALER|nr:hypothetical protein [Salmonella enterica]EBR8572921.1 hypothetical protein [Salmonella enterica subsp. enterica serovar Java]EBW7308914.1 hypothetical protein [Salmonella enterica subsp. enterica serovar Enteritidis]EBW9700581.1 hypothetical protein [Salmonella enterica subsp. enterica serovar Oranienburg]EKN5803837.1 hypothetical protein [Salmonella enterica subsp. enterica]
MKNTHMAVADDIVTLLKLCHDRSSEKEGVAHLAPEEYTRDDDPFADRIRRATGHVRQLQYLLPVVVQLSATGVEPERQGKIQVSVGEDHAQRVPAYFAVPYPDQAGAGL